MIGHDHPCSELAKTPCALGFKQRLLDTSGDAGFRHPTWAQAASLQFTIHGYEVGASSDRCRASRKGAMEPPGNKELDSVWMPMRQVSAVH